MALGACTREYFLLADKKQIVGQAGTRLAFFPFPFVMSGPQTHGTKLPSVRVYLPTQRILSGSPIIDVHRCASLISKVILNASESKD